MSKDSPTAASQHSSTDELTEHYLSHKIGHAFFGLPGAVLSTLFWPTTLGDDRPPQSQIEIDLNETTDQAAEKEEFTISACDAISEEEKHAQQLAKIQELEKIRDTQPALFGSLINNAIYGAGISDEQSKLLTKALIESKQHAANPQTSNILNTKEEIPNSSEMSWLQEYGPTGLSIASLASQAAITAFAPEATLAVRLTPIAMRGVALVWGKANEILARSTQKSLKADFQHYLVATACHQYHTNDEFKKLLSGLAKKTNQSFNFDIEIEQLANNLPPQIQNMLSIIHRKDINNLSENQIFQILLQSQKEHYEEIFERFNQLKQAATSQQEKQKLLSKLEDETREVRGAIAVGTFFLHHVIGKEHLASQFQTTALSVHSIYDSFSRFRLGNIGMFALSGNILGAIGSIMGVFKRRKPNELGRHLRRIQEMLSAIQQDMHSGFQHLSQNQQEIINQLQIVLNNQINLQIGIRKIQQRIDNTHQVLLESDYRRYMNDVELAFKNVLAAIHREHFSLKNYNREINLIHHYAVSVARFPLFAGKIDHRYLIGDTNQITGQLIAILENRPTLQWHFQHLAQVYELLNLDFPRLNTQEELPNPMEWLRGTSMFLSILSIHINLVDDEIIQQQIYSLWRTGLELREFINIAGSKLTIKKLIKKYELALINLTPKLKSFFSEFAGRASDEKLSTLLSSEAGFQEMKQSCLEELRQFSLISIGLMNAVQFNLARQTHINHGNLNSLNRPLFEGLFSPQHIFSLLHRHKSSEIEFFSSLEKTSEETIKQIENLTIYMNYRKSIPEIEQTLFQIKAFAEIYIPTLLLPLPILTAAEPLSELEKTLINIREKGETELDLSDIFSIDYNGPLRTQTLPLQSESGILKISPTNKLVTGELKQYDLETGEITVLYPDLSTLAEGEQLLLHKPSDIIFKGNFDKKDDVETYDFITGKNIKDSLNSLPIDSTGELTRLSDERLLIYHPSSFRKPGKISIYDIYSGETTITIDNITASEAVKITPNNRYFIYREKNKRCVVILDLITGKTVHQLFDFAGIVRLILPINDSAFLANSGDCEFSLWDIETGKCLSRFEDKVSEDSSRYVALSNDLLLVINHPVINIINLKSGDLMGQSTCNLKIIDTLPDNRMISYDNKTQSFHLISFAYKGNFEDVQAIIADLETNTSIVNVKWGSFEPLSEEEKLCKQAVDNIIKQNRSLFESKSPLKQNLLTKVFCFWKKQDNKYTAGTHEDQTQSEASSTKQTNDFKARCPELL